MVERTIPAPERVAGRPSPRVLMPGRGRYSRAAYAWPIVAVAIVGLAVLFVVLTGARPAYDAYGWLVWGHQALRLKLDTNAAPSWKPLPFLFTFPYAVAGRGSVWAWMVTSTAAAFAAPIFAGRIAYRLAGTPPAPRWGGMLAAVFAGVAVLGLAGYWHFVLIDTADPMMVTLGLASIDAYLYGRRRTAWVLLVLLALGRPEAWPLVVLYAAWAWRAVPSMRTSLLLGGAALVLLWLGMARLTSPSFFVASDVDLRTTVPLAGDRVTATLNGFFSLYELPMQLAVLVALGVAILRRERRWLVIAGVALVWMAVEVGLALHGWHPAPRYMLEPAAVLVVLIGTAAGRVLTLRSWPVRLIACAALVALVVVMTPHARARGRLAHNGIVLGQTWALVIKRLDHVVAKDGRAHILGCGTPVTTVPFQSILAWELGENVGDIGSVPQDSVRSGRPIVLFQPYFAGWKILPIHTHGRSCTRLTATTAATGASLASKVSAP